jgi:hypothetical protein
MRYLKPAVVGMLYALILAMAIVVVSMMLTLSYVGSESVGGGSASVPALLLPVAAAAGFVFGFSRTLRRQT